MFPHFPTITRLAYQVPLNFPPRFESSKNRGRGWPSLHFGVKIGTSRRRFRRVRTRMRPRKVEHLPRAQAARGEKRRRHGRVRHARNRTKTPLFSRCPTSKRFHLIRDCERRYRRHFPHRARGILISFVAPIAPWGTWKLWDSMRMERGLSSLPAH